MRTNNIVRHMGGHLQLPHSRRSWKLSLGFTLIELMVVITIIGLLAGILMVSLAGSRRIARDRRRVSDIQLVHAAYQAWVKQEGRQVIYDYPYTGTCVVMDGWDCSYDGSFIARMVTAGYQPQQYRDPLHPNRQYTYLYEGFPGTGTWQNCQRPFYILVAFTETDGMNAAQNDSTCWSGPFSNDPRAFVIIGR